MIVTPPYSAMHVTASSPLCHPAGRAEQEERPWRRAGRGAGSGGPGGFPVCGGHAAAQVWHAGRGGADDGGGVGLQTARGKQGVARDVTMRGRPSNGAWWQCRRQSANCQISFHEGFIPRAPTHPRRSAGTPGGATPPARTWAARGAGGRPAALPARTRRTWRTPATAAPPAACA